MARSDVCVSHDEPDLAGHSFLSPQLRVKWAEEEEERLRRPEHQVLKVDAPGRLSPFLPVPRGCLPHPGSLQDALCHPKSLLWPRGHLVLGGSFETTFYVVGAKRFSALPPKEKFVGGTPRRGPASPSRSWRRLSGQLRPSWRSVQTTRGHSLWPGGGTERHTGKARERAGAGLQGHILAACPVCFPFLSASFI